MKADIKERWLKALRSGEYSQTPGQLGVETFDNEDNANGYCCLGVLCEIAVEDKIVTREVTPTGTVKYIASDDDVQQMVLPQAIVAWAELEGENPSLDTDGFEVEVDNQIRDNTTLSELNDYAKWNFDQIADFIEAKL
jgi:hypothetical protein